MNAKKLIVTAKALNPELDGNIVDAGEYTFPVWEFENGAILVPCESTNDYFFNSRNEIEANGNDIINSVEETDEEIQWTTEEIKEAITASESEFGSSDDDAKIKELINQ